jgi:predicted metal-dependent phosphoesterase TrpH
MIADLHCHSRCSDGSLTIEELVIAAKSRGIETLSITDHDTIAGQERAKRSAFEYGINYIPGIEISAYDPGTEKKVHILGYGFESPARSLKALCDPILEQRHLNTLRQIGILEKNSYPISEEEVRKEAGESRILYKQHIMQVLVKKGITDNIYSDLYRQLFKNNGIASGDIEYVKVQDAVRAVLEDGGIPVLAHPGQQNSFHLIYPLTKLGLLGIELNHPEHSDQHKARIKKAAKEYNLMLTGGSDFHGLYGSPCDLGEVQAPNSFSLHWNKMVRR